MSLDDQISYHSSRAMRELDLGLIAKSVPAARAHLRLSSLHLDRLRELKGDGDLAPHSR
jgi:hypothetical protein